MFTPTCGGVASWASPLLRDPQSGVPALATQICILETLDLALAFLLHAGSTIDPEHFVRILEVILSLNPLAAPQVLFKIALDTSTYPCT